MLATKIRALCRERKISVAQLEEKTEIGKNSIYDWNRVNPSVDKVKRVADVLGVSIDELLREEPDDAKGAT